MKKRFKRDWINLMSPEDIDELNDWMDGLNNNSVDELDKFIDHLEREYHDNREEEAKRILLYARRQTRS